MRLVERTATRVVVEHGASPLAPVAAALLLLAAIGAGAWHVRTDAWSYLILAGFLGLLALYFLKLSHGIRITLDAGENIAAWERTGPIPASRTVRLSEVGGVVLVPVSEDAALFEPVLKVGAREWRLATRAVTDAESIRDAILDVLDLAKGRRSI